MCLDTFTNVRNNITVLSKFELHICVCKTNVLTS